MRGGKCFKRHEVKKRKTPPPNFEPAQQPDGIYELCGPKVQGNAEKFERHVLIPHGREVLDAPRTYDELKAWLADKDIEGIVWHHPDGRMVKIKKRDFGLKR